MKVCIPIQESKGLESIAYDHFGSAPFFLIYDLETEEVKVIQNEDLHHAHGMCQPLKALAGETVDVILVGGIILMFGLSYIFLNNEKQNIESN